MCMSMLINAMLFAFIREVQQYYPFGCAIEISDKNLILNTLE